MAIGDIKEGRKVLELTRKVGAIGIQAIGLR